MPPCIPTAFLVYILVTIGDGRVGGGGNWVTYWATYRFAVAHSFLIGGGRPLLDFDVELPEMPSVS